MSLNSLCIEELDEFNRDNTQRIMYELQSFDDKLDRVRVDMAKLKTLLKTNTTGTGKNKVPKQEQEAKNKEGSISF